MKDYYVILTGAKNNAGDFLIKYRAKELFTKVRPDREIIDYNAWEYIDDKKLKVINNAKALILMGGPSLQHNIYPGIYKLRRDLDDIKTPIIAMGIGAKPLDPNWEAVYSYKISNTGNQLLERLKNSPFLISVRDYHTKSILNQKGVTNIVMTGCPAYYDVLKSTHTQFKIKNPPLKVSFSLGVSFIQNTEMKKQMKEAILLMKNIFKDSDFKVVFHHSIKKDAVLSGFISEKHHQKHLEFLEWIKKERIDYVDISGSAENLINHYQQRDLHIGYRVHAHIYHLFL